VSVLKSMGPGHNPQLTRINGNCIQRLLRPCDCRAAILERRNPEFVDNYCEQGDALIEEPLVHVPGGWSATLPLRGRRPTTGKVRVARDSAP